MCASACSFDFLTPFRYLGLAIGKRLIDEISPTTRLTIVVTSRTFPNVKHAITELKEHVRKHHADRPALVDFDYVTVDLANMVSLCAAIRELELRLAKIDYIFLNACLALYDGIDWSQACVQTLQNPVEAFTYARYKKQRRVKPTGDGMGSVFQANVFAPWYLVRRLAAARLVDATKLEVVDSPEVPLLRPGSKVFWVSSLTADSLYDDGTSKDKPPRFDIDDMELLQSAESYEGSKREIDLLHHATAQMLQDNYGVTSVLVQPGIFKSTSFTPTLNVFSYFGMMLAFYLCRLLGSPYHNIDPWKAASAFTTLAVKTPADQIDLFVKYGSATNWKGKEYLLQEKVPGLEDGFDAEKAVAAGGDASATRNRSNGQAYKVYLYVEALYKQWEEKLQGQVLERYLF